MNMKVMEKGVKINVTEEPQVDGVPEGFTLERLGIPKDGESYLRGNGTVKLVKLGTGCPSVGVIRPILKKIIKIIDMSQCKVDIEDMACEGTIDSYRDYMHFVDFATSEDTVYKYRVREAHTFFNDGEDDVCPLPEGLRVVVTYRNGNTCVVFTGVHTLEWQWRGSDGDIIGFMVVGTVIGWKYEYE